jgi:hypothetical protein
MKTIIVLITALVSFNSFARATDTSDHVTCPLDTVSESNAGLSSISQVGELISEKELKKITKDLCVEIVIARDTALDVPNWERTMKKHLGYSGTSEDFPKYFNNFLNQYKNKLICPQYTIGARGYPAQHIFKRLLATSLNETYEEYFFNLENGDVDFNAYQIIDNKKETVLDWVEKWIASGKGDPEELRDVASVLEDEFEAKRGCEL